MAGSYAVVGNDGSHVLGGSITTGSGAPPAVLASLAGFSDHLPVFADYVVVVVPEPGAAAICFPGVLLTIRKRRLGLRAGPARAGADNGGARGMAVALEGHRPAAVT